MVVNKVLTKPLQWPQSRAEIQCHLHPQNSRKMFPSHQGLGEGTPPHLRRTCSDHTATATTFSSAPTMVGQDTVGMSYVKARIEAISS